MNETLTFKVEDPDYRGIHAVRFLCPRCKRSEHLIHVWGDQPTEVHTNITINGEEMTMRVWNYKSDCDSGWTQRMTISPSVDLHCKCGGWHGHIVNGQFNPA